MAIRKTGARRITVDGHAYLWRVRHRDPEPDNRGWGWAFAVQHAALPGSTLIVALSRRHPRWDQHALPVLPSAVARCIREALGMGWQPTTPGRPFHMVDVFGMVPPEEPRAEPEAPADRPGT